MKERSRIKRLNGGTSLSLLSLSDHIPKATLLALYFFVIWVLAVAKTCSPSTPSFFCLSVWCILAESL